jgi:hypothetical protein
MRKGHVAHIREKRHVYSVLIGKPKGKRSLGRPRHRRDDIRIDLKELGWGSINWSYLAEDTDQ